MTNVLIVYDSWQGHTKAVAEVVAAGVRSVDHATAIAKTTDETGRVDLSGCDALVLGSPVHQRSMSWPMKRFVDLVCEPAWFDDILVGKAAGVFTTGGGHGDTGGGCELCQLGLLGNLAALGMVLVTLPKTAPGFDVAGMHWGPHVRSATPRDMNPLAPDGLNVEALGAAHAYGAHVARVAGRLKDLDVPRGAWWPTDEVRALRRRMEAEANAGRS